MDIEVNDGGGWRVYDAVEGSTVLAALQENGIFIDAPCGGGGTCGKCRVMVHDAQGTRDALACETPVSAGLRITTGKSRPMAVSTGGLSAVSGADGCGYGAAFDIGTTTIVCRVIDCSNGRILATQGRPNPQIPFGADVIARISACMNGQQPKMTELLQDACAAMLREACSACGIEPSSIERISVAGNTTIEHLAAGIDPTPIGVIPFTPPTLFGSTGPFAPGFPDAYFLPCVAGYVGGDITAGIIATGMHDSDATILLVDLGTNGEMALGSKAGITSCATAAGPVFEGASITFGMPAYPGAISQVSLDGSSLRLTVLGDEAPIGICGTGLIDAVALFLETGLVDETGYLADEDEAPAHLAHLAGEVNGETAIRLAEGVYITQKDIRSLQLAKAAVCGGIRTMIDDAGMEVGGIDSLVIAGGFGEYLNLDSAAKVGLFPRELRECAVSAGNTAIEGASAVLASSASRTDIERAAQVCRYIELSASAAFNAYYVEEMVFGEDD